MEKQYLSYRLSIVCGKRAHKAEFATRMDLEFVALRLEETKRSDRFSFHIARSEENNYSSDAKSRFTGNWIGITGSTFFPGKVNVFEMDLDYTYFGFKAEYKQMALGTGKVTTYVGSGYFMFRQLWVLVEESNKQEFTCLSFQIPRDGEVSMLPGVFLGRGGDLRSPSTVHAASGKACVMRGDQCEMLRKMMRDVGWVDIDDLKNNSPNEDIKNLISHAIPNIDQGDLVLRAGLLPSN